MKQVITIHGGNTHESYEDYLEYLEEADVDLDKLRKKGTMWRRELPKTLGGDFDVLEIRMPSKQNAKYAEWKLWFEKHVPHLDDDVVFVGHSLGGLFLVKYLLENEYPKTILGTLLVAPPFEATRESIGDFTLPDNLSRLEAQGGEIHIYHSRDDDVVPVAHAKKYSEALPSATLHLFDDRGHFLVEEFPEIEEKIKELCA